MLANNIFAVEESGYKCESPLLSPKTRQAPLAQAYAHASSRLNTSVAFVPPKPNEFDSTVPIRALSIRLRTIGMSAKTGSSSAMWALSQMKPLFIINSE